MLTHGKHFTVIQQYNVFQISQILLSDPSQILTFQVQHNISITTPLCGATADGFQTKLLVSSCFFEVL